MKVEYINPFIQGSQNVLATVCGESPRLGKLFAKNHPYTSGQVSILINIKGDISGCVVFTMGSETACHIASRMMFGMPVSELDDMSKSAISELGNMISGNVATIFSGIGRIADISTPNFYMGENTGELINDDNNIICMPLQFENGYVFEVDVSLSD